MTQPASAVRTDIDGLRAAAVMLVVLHHLAPAALPGGFVGVDVFFVISGFLVTGLIEQSISSQNFRYLDFIWRRCRRIVPALGAVLLGTLVAGACVMTGPELANLARHVVAGSLSGANLLLLSEVGYFDTAASVKPLLHLWSLGVEEQFYLLWPVILLALPGKRRVRLLAVLAITLASLLASESLVYADPAQAFYTLQSRAWQIGAGATLSLVLPMLRTSLVSSTHLALRIRDMLSMIALAIIGYTSLRATPASAWPGLAAVPIVAATCVLIAVGPTAFINRSLLSARGAQWLGHRSYALYLWHWPPLAFLNVLAHEREWTAVEVQVQAMIVMIPVMVLAHLTYTRIEVPVRAAGNKTALREPIRVRHLLPYGAILGSLVAAALTIMQLRGLPSRYASRGIDAVAALRAADPDSITAYTRDVSRCRLPDRGSATWCWRTTGTGARVAVYGDSHAEVLFAGLHALDADLPLFLTGRKGCAPLLRNTEIGERTGEICRRAMNIAHAALVRDTSVSTVLVAARGPAYLSGSGYGIDSLRPVVPVVTGDAQTRELAFEMGLHRALAELLHAGKRVILVLDVPEIGFLPEQCLIGRPFGLRTVRIPCAVSRHEVDLRNHRYLALVRRLRARLPALEVYDASGTLCDSRFCQAERSGRLLYSDANHLTIHGSRLVATQLMSMLSTHRHPETVGVVAKQR